MDFTEVIDLEFLTSLGYVTLVSSILTMILTQAVKVILSKKGKIYEGMDASEKDSILTKVGRIIALVIYSGLYVGNEFYLKNHLSFDASLLTGLLSGSVVTLALAKGIYTSIRQCDKKRKVFHKLHEAENLIKELTEGKVLKETAETEPADTKENDSKQIFKINKNKDE